MITTITLGTHHYIVPGERHTDGVNLTAALTVPCDCDCVDMFDCVFVCVC